MTSSDYSHPGIYCAINTSNGKVYVGQSINIANRIADHRRNFDKVDMYFYKAIRKHGWDAFEFSALERVDDLSLLDEREKFWIDELDSCNDEVGYNLQLDPRYGPMRGRKSSPETRAKIAEANKNRSQETRDKIGAAHRGKPKPHGQPMRDKLRALRLAGKGGGIPCRPVDQLDKETGEVIATFPSIGKAARALGIKSDIHITQCARGGDPEYQTAGGYRWRYH